MRLPFIRILWYPLTLMLAIGVEELSCNKRTQILTVCYDGKMLAFMTVKLINLQIIIKSCSVSV